MCECVCVRVCTCVCVCVCSLSQMKINRFCVRSHKTNRIATKITTKYVIGIVILKDHQIIGSEINNFV